MLWPAPSASRICGYGFLKGGDLGIDRAALLCEAGLMLGERAIVADRAGDKLVQLNRQPTSGVGEKTLDARKVASQRGSKRGRIPERDGVVLPIGLKAEVGQLVERSGQTRSGYGRKAQGAQARGDVIG